MSAFDVGTAFRKGSDGKAPGAEQIRTLNAVPKQRTAEAAGAPPVYAPNVGDTSAPRDLQEAADYHLAPLGQHPSARNKMLLTSASYMVSFTGFDRVDTLLTQPVLIVAGTEAGLFWHSAELYALAAGPKELGLIEGATHTDLYDGPSAGRAMAKLSPSFTRML